MQLTDKQYAFRMALLKERVCLFNELIRYAEVEREKSIDEIDALIDKFFEVRPNDKEALYDLGNG